MHVEDETLNCFPNRQNRNAYPIIDKNYGNNSETVLIYDRYLCSTGCPKKAGFRINIISKRID